MPLKKFTWILAVIPLAAFAIGMRVVTETHGTTSPVTGTAPSSIPDFAKHLRLWMVEKIRVSVCAPSGQTLSGGGNLVGYDWSPEVGLWGKSPPSTLAMTNCTAVRCCYFDLDNVLGGVGAATWIPDAITFSGGSSGLVVTAEGTWR